jgi:eukaryotic-like serine/threonine-protein kinase
MVMDVKSDRTENNVDRAATSRGPGNLQAKRNRFGAKAIVLVSTCVLAVVILAWFLGASPHLPTHPLDTRWIADTDGGAGNQPNYLRVVSSVAFSPDGKRIAAGMTFSGGSGIDKEEHWVRVWDAATGHQDLALKGHTASVTSVAFSPEGKRIASGSWDKTVKVWDATTGREILTFKGQPDMVTCVAFSPDGERIASGCWDRTVAVWNATSGAVSLTRQGHPYPVMCVAFSPDGKRIAASGAIDSNTIKVWDVASGREVLSLPDCADSVTFSPDGKRIASALTPDAVKFRDGVLSNDYGVQVWDAAGGQKILSLKGHSGSVGSVAYSPDGKRIASGSGDHTAKVWDATNGKEILTFRGHRGAVMCVAFSPDGKLIASGSEDKTVKVWDAANGQEILTLRPLTSP